MRLRRLLRRLRRHLRGLELFVRVVVEQLAVAHRVAHQVVQTVVELLVLHHGGPACVADGASTAGSVGHIVVVRRHELQEQVL
jgi:hypothetical protein